VQLVAPTVWTTLALTIHADGSAEHEVVGASPFPRHWVYDGSGRLVEKSGLIDFARWRSASSRHTPWGDEESPALMTEVETALERELSRLIIDARPSFRALKQGATLVRQGEPGRELFLLFEGVMAVEVDGEVVTEVGPGAILGEMALLQHDVMLVSVVPARVRDRDEMLATLADTLGADPGELGVRLQGSMKDTVARIVAEVPVAAAARSGGAQLRAPQGAGRTGGSAHRDAAGGHPLPRRGRPGGPGRPGGVG
jgi:hypothetical protein